MCLHVVLQGVYEVFVLQSFCCARFLQVVYNGLLFYLCLRLLFVVVYELYKVFTKPSQGVHKAFRGLPQGFYEFVHTVCLPGVYDVFYKAFTMC